MATVGDIVIDVKVNASQVQKEMENTKNTVKKKAQEMDKALTESTQKTGDKLKKPAQEYAKGVEEAGDKAKNSTKKAGDDIGRTVENTGKQVNDNVKKTGDAVNNTTKSVESGTNKIGTALQSAGNRITGFGKKIKSALQTDAAIAFAAVGAAATAFAKQCIDSAIKAESEWTRFGAMVNQSGGNWEAQQTGIKDWARSFSNSMGYAVTDTREASLNLLQYGLNIDQVKQGMSGVAGLAARAGISEAEASKVIITALAGRGNQLKKLTGLKIDDYRLDKNHIDTMRLLTDLYHQNEEALSKHADTTEAQMARVDNSWNMLKTTIGTSLMPVVKIIADVLWTVAEAFNKLPAPVKTALSAFLLIGGVITTVIGVLGMFAPGIIAIGGAVGGLAGVFTLLTGPVGIAIAAIVALVGTLYYLYTTNETVRNALNGLAGWIGSAFMGIWNALAPVLQGLWQWLTQLGSSILGVLIPRFADMQQAVQPIISVFQHLFSALQRLWNVLSGVDGSGASSGFNLIAAAGNFLKIVITALVDIGLRLINGVLQVLSGVVVVVVGAFTLLVDVITLVAGGAQQAGGFFSWLGEQFNQFVSTVMSKGQSIIDIFTSIFGVLTGNVDPSTAFNTIVDSIRNIISGTIVEIFVNEFNNVFNSLSDFANNVGSTIMTTLTAIPNQIMLFFQQIGASILQALVLIPTQIGMFFMSIGTTIMTALMNAIMVIGVYIGLIRQIIITRFQMMVASVGMVWSMIVNAIRTKLMQAWTAAGMLAGMIRTAIINAFNTLTGRVRSIFTNIVNTIRQRLQNAVSQARSKAQQIYQGIKDKVSSIPQMVADEFNKIKEKIRNALDAAKNVAVSKISELVAAVKGALGIASPGFIQRMFTYEFTSIPEIISSESVLAIKEAGNMANGIVETWNDNFGEGLSVPFKNIKGQMIDELGVGNYSYDISGVTGLDMNLLGQNIASVPQGMSSQTNTVDNSTVVHEAEKRTIVIENFNNTMEMGNLNTQESRQVLFKALDGLYKGV